MWDSLHPGVWKVKYIAMMKADELRGLDLKQSYLSRGFGSYRVWNSVCLSSFTAGSTGILHVNKRWPTISPVPPSTAFSVSLAGSLNRLPPHAWNSRVELHGLAGFWPEDGRLWAEFGTCGQFGDGREVEDGCWVDSVRAGGTQIAYSETW